MADRRHPVPPSLPGHNRRSRWPRSPQREFSAIRPFHQQQRPLPLRATAVLVRAESGAGRPRPVPARRSYGLLTVTVVAPGT
jgi:hypothetical protein